MTVNQTLTAITVSPASVNLPTGGTQQYTATAEDQFGAALALQPTFAWAATAGTISTAGLLTAPDTPAANATVTASSGTVSGTATFSAANPPTVAVSAAASPNVVTGTTCNLSALGADTAGESNLTYTWSTTGTPPAAVSYSANGSNAAKNTTATFTAAGNYSFQVTITDPSGLTATSTVNVTVNQTLTAITVSPASVNLTAGGTQQYTATAKDQFGTAMALQPTFTWATTAGTITAAGLLTAPNTSAASATVTAGSGSVNGTATFSATAQPPTVAAPAAASPNTVTGTTCNLSALGADDTGESNLTYTWSTTGTPPAAVSFSTNGSNAAKNTTATFTAAGDYSFQVTIADLSGLTATSTVNVTVNQTLTAITVSPPSVGLPAGGTQQYTATAEDQFGAALTTQPTFTWATTAGTITTAGLLTAPGTPTANATVTAASGTVNGTATFSADQPPTVAVPAAASPSTVTGTTCNLSALGADAAGESNLTYTWSTTGTPPPAVSFSTNGSNAAKNTTATFTAAGSYSFQVTITDPSGLTATSTVNVTVNQTLTAITVSPASVSLPAGGTQQYTATAEDQFGAALALQPTFTWATTAGTITTAGLLTAPETPVANATVTASSGGVSGTATFSAAQPPTVAVPAAASPSTVTGTTCNLSALGADAAGESDLTYTWSTTGTPPAAVSFSTNGSNAAKNTTATFTAAGNYSFQVTITDPGGLTAASTVNVTVNQTLTAITVSPASVSLACRRHATVHGHG